MNRNQAQQSWFLSDSAFNALFYPFPGVFLDICGTGMVRIDARSQSVDDAFTDPNFIKQSRLFNLQEQEVESIRGGVTDGYNDLKAQAAAYSEHRMGFLFHQTMDKGQHVNSEFWAHQTRIIFQGVAQSLVLFSTTGGAAGFAEGACGRKSSSNPAMAKQVEQRARMLGVQGLKNLRFIVRVLGQHPMKSAACSCAVQNVYLEQLVSSDVHSDDFLVSLAAKAIAHLHRQLVHYRSTDPNRLAEAPSVLPPDPDMCAYCGKESSTRLHCSQCKMLWYCSPECQTKHWKMKGPFRHRRECKLLADPSVLPPAIPVGRLVMIHGLKSAAGKRLNGKDAFVVTQSTGSGRLGVVLEDDLSKEDIERLKMGNASWVPNELQKAIKIENLELVWSRSPKNT